MFKNKNNIAKHYGNKLKSKNYKNKLKNSVFCDNFTGEIPPVPPVTPP